ncbi:unnamed protein product [Owenia fusiformis]|uniref:Uncharacterized protein n=1 Tax=Owenia fusiformis TaxID=6347 RepID=A0A8S4Q1E5_OWEFU|nr:unnamed protein product [Owenia fusiformis]
MENTWNGCLINHLFTFRCVGFQCYHCDGKTKQFNAIIQHLILKHPENEMKIRKIINVNGTIKLITKNFSDVIPSEIEASGKKIVIQDQDSMTISIAQYLDSDVPHVSKCSKLDIDSNNEMKCRTTMDNNIEKENEIENKIENETTNEITNEMNDIINLKSCHSNEAHSSTDGNATIQMLDENIEDLINEFTSVLPDVIQRLADDGSIRTILNFFNLVTILPNIRDSRSLHEFEKKLFFSKTT